MNTSPIHPSAGSRRGLRLWLLTAVALLATSGWLTGVAPKASAAGLRVDLRVLVLDDDSPWVDAISAQLSVEGVPYTAVPLAAATRPQVTAAFLATADRGYYQAIIAPDAGLTGLAAEEVSAVRAYEATFGVREVDGFNWPSAAVGLQPPLWAGDPVGMTATVTPEGAAAGFQYLQGSVPIGAGSWAYLAQPMATPPAGESFEMLVAAPIPGSGELGSLLGVHRAGGVERLVITTAMSFGQLHFKYVAHGLLSWATKGVHLGLNRNRLTFHIDDAFAADALWDPTRNCTPGEDCSGEATTARMTPDDVAYAVQWQAANDYTFTLAFNGFYADAADPLTQAFVANRSSFRWLNHGYEHIYQGCVQDFSVTPWRCVTDANGIVWVPAATIAAEIAQNVAVGTSLGLPFDSREYLSGEHSGLVQLPQQPVDNPNFATALTSTGVRAIGTDASRETASRTVGSAVTIPRHPTILYYNAATVAQLVDEYNWLYTTRADGGGGYCEDNPATATCVAPANEADFLARIVPSDAAFDLSFVLSNDPRPFFAHTTNMTGDRLLYALAETILDTYRAVFADTTPLQNLTLTDASRELRRQQAWAVTGMAASPTVSASVADGVVTVVNTAGVRVPITVPAGTVVVGASLDAYGGELSGWLEPSATTTAVLPTAVLEAPVITSAPGLTVAAGQTFSFVVQTTGTPVPTITRSGSLPSGVTFVDRRDGTALLSGRTSSSAGGTYRLTITATNLQGTARQTFTLVVTRPPAITSDSTWTTRVGSTSTFTIRSTGYPTPTLAVAGTVPPGMRVTLRTDGTARLTGSPTTAGTYVMQVRATNLAGSATQTLTVRVRPRWG